MNAVKFEEELPEGWTFLPFGNMKPSTERFDPTKEDNQRYLGLKHIEKDTGKIIGSQESKTTVSLKTIFCKGDLLYGKLRPYLNKATIADFNGVCSTDILVFPQNPFILNIFLKFCLLKSDFVEFANRTVTGVQHPRTSHKKLSNYPIPLPPLPEQRRIVAKIESIFAQIDAAKEQLKYALELTKICRQSVLKSVFEGKLTKRWRSENEHNVNIQWFDYDKRKNAIMKIYNKNFQNIIIPHEWHWLNIELLSTSLKNGIYKQKKFYVENGIPCLRMYNINNWKLIWKNIKRLQLTSTEISEYKLEFNDILINRVNSRELVGKSALIPKNIEECVFESKNIRLRLKAKYINPQFVHLWLIFASKYYFYNNFQQTTGMASINQTQVEQLPVPFCSIGEQKYIVARIESIFAEIDAIEQYVKSTLQLLDQLKNSTLKQAFEGKLVPQDPNDEPAEFILQKIKQ